MFHMKRFTSKTQKIGKYGEDICVTFLKRQNFRILEQNYTKKVGEIDIIAQKNNILYFIEVKSILCKDAENVSYETLYNPTQNVSREKIYKLHKTIFTYIQEKRVSHETPWQLDVYVVHIDIKNKKHKIKKIENIV